MLSVLTHKSLYMLSAWTLTLSGLRTRTLDSVLLHGWKLTKRRVPNRQACLACSGVQTSCPSLSHRYRTNSSQRELLSAPCHSHRGRAWRRHKTEIFVNCTSSQAPSMPAKPRAGTYSKQNHFCN